MKKLRVLIADDHDETRRQMVVFLCRHYQVVGAVTDGEELVKSATCLLPAVIVSDILMPRLDSLAARKKLIAQGKRIPFVFVSGAGPEVMEIPLKERSVAFVYKSEISMHLVNAVEAVYKRRIYHSSFYANCFDRPPETKMLCSSRRKGFGRRNRRSSE